MGLQFVTARLFARAQPAAQQAAIHKQKYSKVLYMLTLHRKCTRALTLEKLCQASMGLGAFRTCPWAYLHDVALTSQVTGRPRPGSTVMGSS